MRYHANSLVTQVFLENLKRVIVRAVVYYDHFEFSERLAENRIEALPEIATVVVVQNRNRQCWRLRSSSYPARPCRLDLCRNPFCDAEFGEGRRAHAHSSRRASSPPIAAREAGSSSRRSPWSRRRRP